MTPALTSDRQARQRLLDERIKLVSLAGAVQHMIAEYDRTIGGARYPYADDAFNRQFAKLCRAGFGVFGSDDLHALAIEYDPDFLLSDEPRVSTIDERIGLCSWVAGQGAVA